jgi:hypothetical protein
MKQGEPRAVPDIARDTSRSKRGFIGVLVIGIVSMAVVVVLWLAARGAPSAGTDPNLVPAPVVPARSTAVAVPHATAAPTVIESGSTT